MENTLSLDGEWTLAYFPEKDAMPQTPEELEKFSCPRIPCRVPGNVELDLSRAGELPPLRELLSGLNLTRLHKYESYQWWYSRTFSKPEWNGKTELIFDGIDVFGTVWLNGKEIGRTRNAKLRYTFDVTEFLKEKNVLTVRLAAPLNAVRGKSYDGCFGWTPKFECNYIRKPYHVFGTDINPRLLTAGLWRPVTLRRKPDYELRDMHVFSQLRKDGTAQLFVESFLEVPGYSYDDLTARVRWRCGEDCGTGNPQFDRDLTSGHFGMPWIEIKHPKLWWPAGYGEQPLYDVTLEVLHCGEVVAAKTVKHGIRQIELDRTELNLPEQPGHFRFLVNGVPIFIRGTNWIWANVFHSLDRADLLERVALVKEMNCNMLRMHGGGVYEPPEFYDFCDRNGILIWHDLGMSGQPYPQDDEFAELISEEVRWAVKELRNHPSIALWCGDNEADSMRVFGWFGRKINPDSNKVTRETLARLVSGLDPFRPYLPSSPYLTGKAAELMWQCEDETEMHNVSPEAHKWGPRDYCKSDFYLKRNRNCFASEAGFFGARTLSLLKKYLSPECVWPPYDNPEWNYHSTESFCYRTGTFYRVAQTRQQIENFFGEVPEDAETFIKASQIVLAESDKFLIELYRQRKWHTAGILLWNTIDSWPQTVSDAFVDWEMNRQLVFYYLKRSYTPFLVLCAEPENGQLKLVAANETQLPVSGSLEVILPDSGKTFHFDFSAKANDNTVISTLPMPEGKQLVLLKWRTAKAEYSGVNHYISGNAPLPLKTYLQQWLPAIAELDRSFSAEEVGK